MTVELAGRAEVDEILQELDSLGRAAHAILAHPRLSQADRERGLRQLLAHARRSKVPTLACEAILRQLDASIDGALHEPPRPIGDGWTRRQRVLRAMGYSSCPTCAGAIADEGTLHRLQGVS